MDYFLIHLLTPVSLFTKKVILIIRLSILPIETEHDVIFIIQSFCCFRYSRRMFRVLLFEFGLVGVFGHVGLIATNGEVTLSIANGKRYS